MPKPCSLQSPETEKSNMATRQPFRKWGHWKSISSYSYTQVIGHWSFEFIFNANFTCAPETMPPTKSRNRKIQYGRQATILQMTLLKLIRLLLIYISIVPLKFGVNMLIFEGKVKLESGNQKIQVAILKVTLLKINRLLPMTTIKMHMKFQNEIPKQTWLMLWKPCRLQTDGWTDERTDKVSPVYPPSNLVGWGINIEIWILIGKRISTKNDFLCKCFSFL